MQRRAHTEAMPLVAVEIFFLSVELLDKNAVCYRKLGRASCAIRGNCRRISEKSSP